MIKVLSALALIAATTLVSSQPTPSAQSIASGKNHVSLLANHLLQATDLALENAVRSQIDQETGVRQRRLIEAIIFFKQPTVQDDKKLFELWKTYKRKTDYKRIANASKRACKGSNARCQSLMTGLLSHGSPKQSTILISTMVRAGIEQAIPPVLGHLAQLNGDSPELRAAMLFTIRNPLAIRRELAKLLPKTPHAKALWQLAAKAAPNQTELRDLLAQELSQDNDYKALHALLYAASYYKGPEIVTALGSLLEKNMASDPQQVAIRRMVTEALAFQGDTESALIKLLQDPDPLVRSAALPAAPPQKLAVILKQDPWNFLRKAAAKQASEHCKILHNGLAAAVQADRSPPVRVQALRSLHVCKPARAYTLGLAAIVDGKFRPDFRSEMALFLGQTSVVDELRFTRAIKNLRASLFSDRHNSSVLAAMTPGMARSKRSEMPDLLLKMANDLAFPDVQSAALLSLSKTCPDGTASVIKNAKLSPHNSVKVAARRVAQKCRLVGF